MPTTPRRFRSALVAVTVGAAFVAQAVAAAHAVATQDCSLPTSQAGATITPAQSTLPTAGPSSSATPPTAPIIPRSTGDDDADLADAVGRSSAQHPVLLAARVYHLTRRLELPANAEIDGQGPDSVLQFNWVCANVQGAADIGNADPQTGDQNITLRNFVIDGGASGLPSGPSADNPSGLVHAIRLVNVQSALLQHLEIRHTSGMGINYQGSTDIRVYDNYLHDLGRDGVTGFWLSPTSTVTTGEVRVVNNLIADLGDDAVGLSGDGANTPDSITVTHNQVEGWNLARVRSWTQDQWNQLMGRGVAVTFQKNRSPVPTIDIKQNTIHFTDSNGIFVTSMVNNDEPTCQGPLPQVTVATNTITSAGLTHNPDNPHTNGFNIGAGIYVAFFKSTTIAISNNTISGSRYHDGGAPVIDNPCP